MKTKKHNLKRGWKVLLTFLSILLTDALLLTILLFSWIPGTITPPLDENGEILPVTIAEKILVEINGIQ